MNETKKLGVRESLSSSATAKGANQRGQLRQLGAAIKLTKNGCGKASESSRGRS